MAYWKSYNICAVLLYFFFGLWSELESVLEMEMELKHWNVRKKWKRAASRTN